MTGRGGSGRGRSGRGRSWWRGLAVAVAASLLAVALGQAPAQAAPPTVVSVVVTPAQADVVGGFLDVTLEIALQSATPLQDEIGGAMPFEVPVWAVRADAPAAGAGEALAWVVRWDPLVRVSGTPTDGVWRATTRVSSHWIGTWIVAEAFAGTAGGTLQADLRGFGATFEIGPGTLPPLTAAPAVLGPVKVVTGLEPWTPRLRVTDRATGVGVAAFVGTLDSPFDGISPAAQLPPGSTFTRADAAGYATAAPAPVAGNEGILFAYPVYAGRASRGFSLEATALVAPWVKWQANERFATSGRVVTASGNAWPAPSIYRAANPTIHLQHLVGRTWRTVASSHVRENGRYTITWTAPAAGVHHVRVYKPGGIDGIRWSSGTLLATVSLTLR